MRSFASALGVRCTHCHAGPTAGSLEGVDFATDELEPKKVARAMWKMTDAINGKLLPATGRSSLTQVRCVTCHRGVTDPEPIEAILARAVAESGTAAAVEHYKELRQEYYGTGAYDFSAGTLLAVAEKLAQEKQDADGAITLVRLNLEYDPAAAASYLLLG